MTYTIGIDARKVHDFGIGTYIRHLVHGLAKIDEENQYVLFAGPQRKDAFAGLPENFRVVTEKAPVYSARELVKLAWKQYRMRLDLYHATHYVLPLVNVSRVVVTIHDIIHLLYPQFLPSRMAFLYARTMIKRSLTRGDRIIAVSQTTKQDLMKYFDVTGRKIQVVYNGVDDSFRERLTHEQLARWQRNLGIKPPYLLFVGNPKPHKNLDNVLRAYARARQIHSFDAPLVCVGDRGNAEARIKRHAEQLGVGDKVQLLGHVAQEALPAVYQGATMFLYPTLYEGFGLPVIEAMASGVPVITSNTSALKEMAKGYGHLVDPLDVQGIAQAIAQGMADAEHRESLAEMGLRRADEFRWEKTAERTLRTYMSALRGKTPGKIEALHWPPGGARAREITSVGKRS